MDKLGRFKQMEQLVPSSKANQDEIARRIREAGERALAEAEARRAKSKAEPASKPKEIAGPKGLEPTSYGDWNAKAWFPTFNVPSKPGQMLIRGLEGSM